MQESGSGGEKEATSEEAKKCTGRHPSYRPDLSLWDFHLFRPRKERALQRFENDAVVACATFSTDATIVIMGYCYGKPDFTLQKNKCIAGVYV